MLLQLWRHDGVCQTCLLHSQAGSQRPWRADGTAFDFSEWTQEATGSVVEVAGAYGDCCARVSAGFVLSLLHEHGCDHIGNFPDLVKEDWLDNSQCFGAALRAFRKGF